MNHSPADPSSAGAPLRYVALGDSLSEGVGDDPWPDGTPRGWADRLAALLSTSQQQRRVTYANLCVRGYTATQVRNTQLAAALRLEPEILTLSAGMNDILRPRVDFGQLENTLAELVEPFARQGCRIFVVPIPDTSRIMPAGSLVNGRRERLNAIYAKLAADYGMLAPVDTVNTVFEDARAWDEDRLHLSALGHERLAQAAAASLGVQVDAPWWAVPDGAPARRSLGTEATWWWRHVAPWIGRRLRGRSSGDGRSAKQPVLAAPRLMQPILQGAGYPGEQSLR